MTDLRLNGEMNVDSPEEPDDPVDVSYRPGYQIAAERILAYVADHQLAAGARLPTEKDLSSVLGISRSVVREAVKILSAVGRLSVEKGRGIYVADAGNPMWIQSLPGSQPSDPEQIQALFEIRRALETFAVRLACERATPAQVRQISTIAAESAAAASADDPGAFRVADEQFHRQIASAAQNEYLLSTLTWVQQLHRQMWVLALKSSVPGPMIAAARQHAEIAAAVQTGDAAVAARLVSEHVENTQRQVQRAIRERIFNDVPPEALRG